MYGLLLGIIGFMLVNGQRWETLSKVHGQIGVNETLFNRYLKFSGQEKVYHKKN